MSDFLGYKGKRVVVTGCFSGMGEATAKRLLSLGAEVHGLDYKDCALDLASFTKCDLRDPASIDAAVGGLSGKIDALFNCAGLPQTFPPLEVMKVNFIGTRYLTEKVIPLMQGKGAVASISSNGGLGWSRRMPVLMQILQLQGFDGPLKWCEENLETVGEGYALSKELVIAWTMFASFSLISKGVRINCTTPGPTQTPMMNDFEAASAMSVLEFATRPIDRRSTPDEQASPLVFLNSDAASFISGVSLPVDGGFMAGLATGQLDVAEMMKGATKAA